MSWTSAVACKRCGQRDWVIRNGSWVCRCGQPMHHPVELDERNARARAKLSGAERKKRPSLRSWMLQQFGDGTEAPCAGCGMALTNDTMTIDRYPIPGRDGGRYARGNIRPMCHPCNTSHVGEPTCYPFGAR